MIFNIQLQGEALNTILKYVGAGPHNEVRRVIDDVIAQVQAQEAAAAAPAPQSDTQSAGLSD
jgi:hypothetical protein